MLIHTYYLNYFYIRINQVLRIHTEAVFRKIILQLASIKYKKSFSSCMICIKSRLNQWLEATVFILEKNSDRLINIAVSSLSLWRNILVVFHFVSDQFKDLLICYSKLFLQFFIFSFQLDYLFFSFIHFLGIEFVFVYDSVVVLLEFLRRPYTWAKTFKTTRLTSTLCIS